MNNFDVNITDSLDIKYNLNKIKNNNINDIGTLNVLYLNIRSIRNKFTDIQNLIESYNFTDHFLVHILVLTEIFIYTNQHCIFQLSNYTSHFLSRDSKRGGGVGIYIRNEIASVRLYDLCYFENNFLCVNLPQLNLNFLIIY